MADNATDAGSTDVGGDAPLQITQEQLDGAINKAFARGAAKVEAAFGPKLAELESKINASQPKPPPEELPSAQAGQKTPEMLALEKRLERADKAAAEMSSKFDAQQQALVGEKIDRALIEALNGARAVDAADALAVLKSKHVVKLSDDGQVLVTDAEGVPVKTGEFIPAFLASRPHLVKAPDQSGAGAQGGKGGVGGPKGLTQSMIANMPIKELREHMATAGIEVGSDSPFKQPIHFKSLPSDPALIKRREEMGIKTT